MRRGNRDTTPGPVEPELDAREEAPRRSRRGSTACAGSSPSPRCSSILGAVGVWIERVAPRSRDLERHERQDPRGRDGAADARDVHRRPGLCQRRRRRAAPSRAAAPGQAARRACCRGLHDGAERLTQRILAWPRVQQAWRAANKAADQQVIRMLDDEGRFVRTNGGEVAIDLRPIVQQVVGRVGLTDRVEGRLPPNAGRSCCWSPDQLSAAQTGVQVLRNVAELLVIIVVLIFAGAVWVAPDRRRAVRACAIGAARGRTRADLHAPRARRPADRKVVADDRSALRRTRSGGSPPSSWASRSRSIVFVGVVGLLGAWVAGPGARAVAPRRWLAPYLREPRWPTARWPWSSCCCSPGRRRRRAQLGHDRS